MSNSANEPTSQPQILKRWLTLALITALTLLSVTIVAILWRVLITGDSFRFGPVEISVEHQLPAAKQQHGIAVNPIQNTESVNLIINAVRDVEAAVKDSADQDRNAKARDVITGIIDKIAAGKSVVTTQEAPHLWNYAVMDTFRVGAYFRPKAINGEELSNWGARSTVSEAMQLGAKGWELVSVTNAGGDAQYWIFKKRR